MLPLGIPGKCIFRYWELILTEEEMLRMFVGGRKAGYSPGSSKHLGNRCREWGGENHTR